MSQALPGPGEECTQWKFGARIHQGDHIDIGQAYYSVRYFMIDECVDARPAARTMVTLLRGANIASNPRATWHCQRLTLDAHRPPAQGACLARGADVPLARPERNGFY